MKFLGRNVKKQNDKLFYIVYSSEDVPVRKNTFVREEFTSYEEGVTRLLELHKQEGNCWLNANYDPTC